MREKNKLSSDGGDSGSNKCKKQLWWRLMWGLAESVFGGSLESGSRICVGAFGRNLASVAVKMFSDLIYFIKKFYKCYSFNAIRRDAAAINCITIQHKKKFIPVNFDGSYYASFYILIRKFVK
jgi:hypothetical protein